jgi:hypothetical protein
VEAEDQPTMRRWIARPAQVVLRVRVVLQALVDLQDRLGKTGAARDKAAATRAQMEARKPVVLPELVALREAMAGVSTSARPA